MLKQIVQLLAGIAEDYEHATSWLLEENNEIRQLLNGATKWMNSSPLKERLEKAVISTDTDFKVSALDRSNQDLVEALIELHAYVEDLKNENARQTEEAIWQTLLMRPMRRLPIIMKCGEAASLT